MKLTIGLEIHCKLLTDSKIFCRCHNEQDFETLPANTHVCPTCMGMPGALPTLSSECIEKAGALGMLLGCTQQELSHFDRKSYFYPDLPMGYQITQFNKPLNIKGKVLYHSIDYSEEFSVDIEQAHVECDTAKTTHFNGELLLDFNRAGTPLIEVVTAPQFHSADQVHGFLREIQRTLKYYRISNAEMDKGQMRCDVNISVSNTDALGVKVEIKNMNSISAIKKAITYEYNRQLAVLASGGTIGQETRGRDDGKGESFLLRSKENALDYRYFPEPDLPPLIYTNELREASEGLVGETIAAKIQRYKNEYGFHKEYINGLLTDANITHLFEDGVAKGFDPKILAKYIVNYVLANPTISKLDITHTPFSQEQFFFFLTTIKEQNISDNIAKKIITEYLETRGSMKDIIAANPAQDTSIDLAAIIAEVIAQNDGVVQEYKGGKLTAIGFLVGQVMKKTGGGASPQDVQQGLKEALDK